MEAAKGEIHEGEPRDTLRLIREDPGRAIARLRARVAAGTADFRTWHNLAVALAKQGEPNEALAAAATAVHAAPDSTRTRFLHATLLRDASRFEEALAAFDEVERLDPEFPRLRAHRGAVQFFLRDLDAAARDLEAACAEASGDTQALFNLAVVRVARKQYGEAQNSFQTLMELEPARAARYQHLLVELGRVQVLEETLCQAHRIKNFLGIVGDRLRRLCDDDLSRLEPDVREDLLAIRDDHARIYSDLVVFLGAIRPRALRLERVDLRRLIDRILFVAGGRGQGIAFERDLPGDLPPLTCDGDSVQEALLNVLLNAVDAVRSAAAQRSGWSAGRVRVRVERDGDQLLIGFEDNGVGIPAGELGRIFHFGFTTKSMGSGIGLTYARRVLEDHGGRIEVESVEGQGTTVRCRLPIVARTRESLSNLALRPPWLDDPRELMLEEAAEDLGI